MHDFLLLHPYAPNYREEKTFLLIVCSQLNNMAVVSTDIWLLYIAKFFVVSFVL